MNTQYSSKQLFFENVFIALGYWVISYLNFVLFKSMGFLPMPIWPAAAIAIIVMFYRGAYAAPGVAAGSILANYCALDSTFAFACCIAVMNTLGPYIAAAVMRRRVTVDIVVENFTDIFICFNAAIILAPLLTAFGGITSKYLLGMIDLSGYFSAYAKWAIAHSLGTMFFSLPVFIFLIKKPSVKYDLNKEVPSGNTLEYISLKAGVYLAVFFWIVVSLFEYLWMNSRHGNLFEFFLPRMNMHEMFMRIFVAMAFILCGFAGYKFIIMLKHQHFEARKLAIDLSITLDSIGDGVISTNNAGTITRINPVAEKMTGWKNQDATGRHMSEVFNIINTETRESVINPVDVVISTGMVVGLGSHTTLIAKNGLEYSIADSAAPIVSGGGDGEIIGVIMVFRDVTEEMVVQEKLKHSQRMDAIGQLAGGVAHDFNNMLGGILGFAELLQYKLSENKEATKLIEMIIDTSEKAAGLTQKLLSFARKGSIPSTAIDMHKILEDSIELLKRTIDKRISIRVNIAAEACYIVGDPSQLQNAVINLGINAAHAMVEGGQITIETSNIMVDEADIINNNYSINSGYYLKIDIIDTGCGIEPDVLLRIFEPFFTTKKHGKGTGLGLAAVYGTVQQHKGDISVESKVGDGTAFTILLPVAEEKRFNIAKGNVPFTRGSGRLLVVDDESVMRITAKSILENAGYEVETAQNGKAAVEKFKEFNGEFELVIVDMVMPVMNGKDCFKELKKLDPTVRVLLASGFANDADVSEMKRLGLAGYIAKPYRSFDLDKAIINALHTGDW